MCLEKTKHAGKRCLKKELSVKTMIVCAVQQLRLSSQAGGSFTLPVCW